MIFELKHRWHHIIKLSILIYDVLISLVQFTRIDSQPFLSPSRKSSLPLDLETMMLFILSSILL